MYLRSIYQMILLIFSILKIQKHLTESIKYTSKWRILNRNNIFFIILRVRPNFWNQHLRPQKVLSYKIRPFKILLFHRVPLVQGIKLTFTCLTSSSKLRVQCTSYHFINETRNGRLLPPDVCANLSPIHIVLTQYFWWTSA